MYSIVVYVPESHGEAVKHAMFEAGAGRIGTYDQGCWEVLGRGQFRPLKGSDPYAGEIGKVHVSHEIRLELICDQALIEPVIAAMKDAHPYEVPAYHYVNVHT